jgi:integrase
MQIHKIKSKRLGTVWAIRLMIEGQQIRQRGFRTKAEAEAAVAALQLRARAQRLGLELPEAEITLRELLEKRQGDKSANATRSRARLVGYFAEFVTVTGEDTPVKAIGVADLKRYRDSFDPRYKPSWVNYKIAGVTSSLNAARMYYNELESFRSPLLPDLKEQSRKVVVPRAELQAIIENMRARKRDQAANVVELAILTGARVGEIIALKAKSRMVDIDCLRIYASKTGTERDIPFTPRSRELFDMLDTRSLDYWRVLRPFEQAARRLKIKVGLDGWKIHDLRHTAASKLAEGGVSHSIIAAILGHSVRDTTGLYTHASLPAMREAVMILERFWVGSNVVPIARPGERDKLHA